MEAALYVSIVISAVLSSTALRLERYEAQSASKESMNRQALAIFREKHQDMPAPTVEGGRVLAGAHPQKSVLLLGCSLDRMATAVLCGDLDIFFRFKHANFSYLPQTNCGRDVAIKYVHHSGVGYDGNLTGPYYFQVKPGENDITTETIIERAQQSTKHQAPDLVVVDSSLWDLANWASRDQHLPSKERIGRWCDHDIPLLMQHVEDRFGRGKVVFRTAPDVREDRGKMWSKQNLQDMYTCIMSKLKDGKIFGRWRIIDFHKIFADAQASSASSASMWLPDGFHPTPEATRGYAYAIYTMLGLDPNMIQNVTGRQVSWDAHLADRLDMLD